MISKYVIKLVRFIFQLTPSHAIWSYYLTAFAFKFRYWGRFPLRSDWL